MKTLFKQTVGFLTLLGIALFTLTPFVALADDPAPAQEGEKECLGSTIDELFPPSTDGPNYIVTEINEPIGDVNQKLTAGDLTVSQVYWKYACEYKKAQTESDGTVKTDPATGETLYETISENYYIPFDAEDCPEHPDSTAENPKSYTCNVVQLIVGTSGTAILKTYIALIYRWAAGIVGIVAVLVIVISGIQISIDQGGGENVTEAKNRIMQSLSAIVILFLSALILYTINPTFFQR